MSSSSQEDHERRHSIDDHHQPSNGAFKIRHESSDSAISSGSGLSPVNKIFCSEVQYDSYLCYFVFRYCLMKSFWWKKMKLWWSFQVPTVVQQLDLLTPTSQPLPRPEKIQLGCNWMYQICNIFILSILSIKSFEEAKIEQQWYMIWHHY